MKKHKMFVCIAAIMAHGTSEEPPHDTHNNCSDDHGEFCPHLTPHRFTRGSPVERWRGCSGWCAGTNLPARRRTSPCIEVVS